MEKIEAEILDLKGSPLYNYRTENNYLPVVGEGSLDARIMFIGEAPGKNEAKTGRPFCGRAGSILEGLLNSVGIKRSEVYITNIVKDRPPKNRDPLPEEIEIYGPFLNRQIEIIKPKIIATLGRYSMKYILERFELAHLVQPIGEMHGKVFETGKNQGKIKIAVLYHPCVAIYNRNKMEILEKDFKILKNCAKVLITCV